MKQQYIQLALFNTNVIVSYWAHPYDKKGQLIKNVMQNWIEELEENSWTLKYIQEHYHNVKITR